MKNGIKGYSFYLELNLLIQDKDANGTLNFLNFNFIF